MEALPSYVKLLLEGFAEEPDTAILRSDMESGPPKQTQIKSRVMVGRPAILVFESKADYLAWVEWFRANLNFGRDWFSWFDPVAGATATARIVGGKYKATPTNTTLSRWRVSCNIETWSA